MAINGHDSDATAEGRAYIIGRDSPPNPNPPPGLLKSAHDLQETRAHERDCLSIWDTFSIGERISPTGVQPVGNRLINSKFQGVQITGPTTLLKYGFTSTGKDLLPPGVYSARFGSPSIADNYVITATEVVDGQTFYQAEFSTPPFKDSATVIQVIGTNNELQQVTAILSPPSMTDGYGALPLGVISASSTVTSDLTRIQDGIYGGREYNLVFDSRIALGGNFFFYPQMIFGDWPSGTPFIWNAYFTGRRIVS